MLSEPRTRQTLPQVLVNRVRHFGDKPWVIRGDEVYSYGEIHEQSGRLAAGLARRGVQGGETVLLLLPDGIEIIYCWSALARLGAIEVPVNTHLRGNVLNHLIDDSRARLCIVDGRFLDRILEQESYPCLETLIITGEASGDQKTAAGERFELVPFAACFDDKPFNGGDAPRFNDVGAVMYTSGTTGPSKGVMITHAHAYEYALSVAELLELRDTDVYYNPLPMFHIAGQWAAVYASCIRGATVVLAGGVFSASAFWPEVRRHNATTTFLLGAMANRLAQLEPGDGDRDNPMERMLVVPLLPDTEAFKKRFDVLVSTTWGSTEINCPTRSGFELVDSKSCGYVAEDRFEVRIVDQDDMELPPGVPGEAVVRAKEPWILMAGYWNQPEATARAWRNQWVHSGDMLMKDERGNLYFMDRIKDSIRRSGENISSMEVENEINAYPAVLECAVVPVESENTEQEVKAYLVLKDDDISFDHEDFIRFLEPRMAYFMIPRYIEIIDALPKTQTGKIQKFQLRERGNGDATWDRVAAGVKLDRR